MDYGTKLRLLRIIRALLEHPNGYSRKQLAGLYNVHPDTIRNDFTAIENAGFVLQKDKQHRYTFRFDRTLQEMKDILFFAEEDQVLLMQAIDQIDPHSKRGQRLKRKLDSLYDYHKLGYSNLRRPYLTKIDLLQKAQRDKKCVVLQNYRSSNSGVIKDRTVEPFHPAPADDTLQALDLASGQLRHFRISRIDRVLLTEQDWQHEQRHLVLPTDVFRIVDPKQIQVHLRFKVGAYNELTEKFPQSRNYIEADPVENVYDFQAPINHRFLGLTNFILGFHHQVIEILEPESLIEHLRAQVGMMDFLGKV